MDYIILEKDIHDFCEYLKKEITMLAKELPRHKVVPYANIKRRKQHYSK